MIPPVSGGRWYFPLAPWPQPAVPHPDRVPQLDESSTLWPGPVRGRRPVAFDNQLLELVAVAVDLYGHPLNTLANGIAWPGEQRPRDRLRSELRSARRALYLRGVVPWVCFADGAVPPFWWEQPAFARAVKEWRASAALQRSWR